MSAFSVRDNDAFAKALVALQAYLRDLVVVGGWAHRLYEFHELGRSPGFVPLTTEDADLAARARLRDREESIAESLARKGFKQRSFGDERPPVSHYYLGDSGDAFYVEFLVPLTGSGYRRNGARDATTKVSGVTAQKLRYVEILITEPWTIRLSKRNGFPVGERALEVLIANPVSYLVQKILVLADRRPAKQGKDILYIHDTLLILADALDHLPAAWSRLEASLHRNVRSKLSERRAELFAEVTDPARNAARMAAATNRPDPPTPERLLATCRAGLARIFDQPFTAA